ncbi:hypothetical protein QUF54_06520, partial [Candidatus Marithioploca araucensis]|nr:hypothetical protein [Candidatus Marithioploca araucensis]
MTSNHNTLTDNKAVTLTADTSNLEKAPVTMQGIHPADYIDEAQLLLAYVSQKGLKVDDKIMSIIIRSRHLLEEGKWNVKLEIEFWKAFNTIAGIVHPVSVASLKATYPDSKVKTDNKKFHFQLFRSMAERTVFFYQIGSLFFLFLLLATQTFWLMGSMRMSPVAELTERMKKLDKEIELKYQAEGEVNTQELTALNAKMEDTLARISINYQLLNNWTWQSIWQEFGFSSAKKPILDDTLDNSSPNLPIGMEILLQEKQVVLQIIQTYILPLLYGLLGAYAYVLIQISKEIKNLTYVEESKVSHRLRLQLGALSGLAVGWFITPSSSSLTDASSVLFELSPLTIAFLAGYSVDVLFALMDRLIYTFSASDTIR